MADLRAKAEAEDKVTTEQLGLHFDDITGRYTDFRFAEVGKLHGEKLFTALKLRKRHMERVNISGHTSTSVLLWLLTNYRACTGSQKWWILSRLGSSASSVSR